MRRGVLAVAAAAAILARVEAGYVGRPRPGPRGLSNTSSFDAVTCDFGAPARLPPALSRRVATAAAEVQSLPRAFDLPWPAFVARNSTLDASTAAFLDLKGTNRGDASTLLFMATHASSCHLVHLQACWPGALRNAPRLGKGDVLLYVGAGNESKVPGQESRAPASAASLADALVRLPNDNVSMVWQWWNPGYQLGAVAPMALAARLGWFSPYEWIVRMNPDVSLVHATYLERAMATSATAVVFAWNHPLKILNLDVFAARPSKMDNSKWLRQTQEIKSYRPYGIHAETSTARVFQRHLRTAVIWNKDSVDRQTGSGQRVVSYGLVHDHRLCGRSPW